MSKTIELPDGTPHTFTDEELERGEAMMARLREVEASLVGDTGQTAYSKQLLPCPFCGGEATIVERVIKGGYKVYYVKCKECGVRQNELPKTADGACDLWNCRAECTCRDLTPDSDKLTCSECGAESVGQVHQKPFINVFSYCPNCGARVEEASEDADR